MSLDVSPQQFKRWIDEAGTLIASHYQEHSEAKVFAGKSPAEVQELLDEPLPDAPQNIGSLLDEVGDKILSTITNSAGPRYFGYITGGGNQVAVLA
ncbi:MAG: hypothetical protein GWN00_18965, partial [Aliifodinibius sp.]|nr:hypothetical protein [Fodinibius sp.]NIV13151.1 hypothetical protein [Fodinibius sp.]NIY26813.1 hypothetical protein [Fodinibius sp.]